MFGLPGIDGGFCTFSWNPTMRPSASTSMMPNSLASAFGTGMTATVASAFFCRWKLSICRTSIL